MNFYQYLLLGVGCLSLTGCITAEDKIVDLSGGVFIVYVSLISLKMLTPTITNLSVYKMFSGFILKHIDYVIYPLYLFAVTLLVAGSILGGIHRVHIFSGFTLAVISYSLKQLSVSDESNKKVIFEIITLGISILFVLFLLWSLGSDLFKGL